MILFNLKPLAEYHNLEPVRNTINPIYVPPSDPSEDFFMSDTARLNEYAQSVQGLKFDPRTGIEKGGIWYTDPLYLGLSGAGQLAALVYAFKIKSGFWKGAGLFILGGIAGMTVAGIARAVSPRFSNKELNQ